MGTCAGDGGHANMKKIGEARRCGVHIKDLVVRHCPAGPGNPVIICSGQEHYFRFPFTSIHVLLTPFTR